MPSLTVLCWDCCLQKLLFIFDKKLKMAQNLAVLDCWVALSWEPFPAGANDALSLLESCHHFNKCASLISSAFISAWQHVSSFQIPIPSWLFQPQIFLFISLSHPFPSPPFFSRCCCCGKMKAAEWSGGRESSGNQRAPAAGAVWRQVGDTSKSGTCACCSHLSS